MGLSWPLIICPKLLFVSLRFPKSQQTLKWKTNIVNKISSFGRIGEHTPGLIKYKTYHAGVSPIELVDIILPFCSGKVKPRNTVSAAR